MRGPISRAWDGFLTVLILIAVVVAILACKILHAEYVYDDWTCAFAKCLKVK